MLNPSLGWNLSFRLIFNPLHSLLQRGREETNTLHLFAQGYSWIFKIKWCTNWRRCRVSKTVKNIYSSWWVVVVLPWNHHAPRFNPFVFCLSNHWFWCAKCQVTYRACRLELAMLPSNPRPRLQKVSCTF